jgi:hypothetical protein
MSRGSRDRENPGGSHGRRAVAAKFRTAGHLLAYAADVSERPIQVIHTIYFALQSSLHRKVTCQETFVKG